MKKYSLDSFISYLESMNCEQFLTFISVKINNVTKVSYTSYAAIIFAGIPDRYIVAYKFEHMDVPYIECTMRSFHACKNIVNNLLEV